MGKQPIFFDASGRRAARVRWIAWTAVAVVAVMLTGFGVSVALSPPIAGLQLPGKPVAVMGASPGGLGTILSQNAWLPVLRTLGADLWTGGRLMVSRAGSVFDAGGAIVDARTHDSLRQFVEGFTVFAQASPAGNS